MLDKSHKLYGIYRGTVADDRDTSGRRRLKLKVPQVFGTEITDWAWPREDASTKVQVPAVGQGVWVMFEGGDPAFPLWVGTFGTVQGTGKHGLLKPYSGSTNGMTLVNGANGSVEIDLITTIAQLQARITSLESQVAALQAYNIAHP
jgi:hypothetical protein